MDTSSLNTSRSRVAIILVNWNNWRDCIECLDSVLALRHRRFHVFVVDNDSHDGSVERISAWCRRPRAAPAWRRHEGVDRFSDAPDAQSTGIAHAVIERPSECPNQAEDDGAITLIRAGGNLGYAGGCNVGIRVGDESFDYFWLLNSDTVVHRDALSALLARANQQASIGMVGSTVRFYERAQTVQAMAGSTLDMRTMETRLIGTGGGLAQIPADPSAVERRLAYVFGASMLVSSAFVRDIGPMQEDYFLYYEEFDWALRGLGKYTLGYAPDSHVFHKSGASSSKIMPVFTSRYYYRNRVRFTERFFPGHLAAVRRGLAYELVRHTVRGRWALARVVASALWDLPRLAAQTNSGGTVTRVKTT